MGSGMMKLILEKAGLRLVGCCDTGTAGQGTRIFTTSAGDMEIDIFPDIETLLDVARPQVVLQATCSTVVEAAPDILKVIRQGIHVISIAEEMSFASCAAPALAAELDQTAREHGVTVLGTGINPGFVLDLLAIALSGVCYDVESITARRVNDLSPYGPTVLRSQGVGVSPEAFAKGLEDGSIVGHFGFPESIAMIAKALGWQIDRIEQVREPIVSSVERTTDFMTIGPGMTAGCNHTATAYIGDREVIRLIHPQQVHPHLEGVTTGDYIEIKGTPDIKLSGSPEIPGGIGTTALAVNMIPKVISGPAGLKSMADMPVPAAIMGDAAQMAG